jgi:hypothetical protein
MDILQGIGIIALVIAAYFIYENYSRSQYISPEQDDWLHRYSDAYRELSIEFRAGSIDRGTFEKKKRQILNNPVESRKMVERVEKQNAADLERKEENNRMRIVGYKYDEFIFKIFNDNHELTWAELEDGVQKTFNLEILDREAIREYYEDDMLTPAQEMLNIWFDNKLIEVCDWSKWSEQNRFNLEHCKVGSVLRDKYYKINDYDLTYDEWLKDKDITLKHNKYYDYYLIQKRGIS